MAGTSPQRWEQWIGRLDRRLVYFGLFLFTLIPLAARWSLPLYVTPPPKMLQRAIDELPDDRLVLVASDWDAGSQAENRPQMIALVRHLIRKRRRFAVLSVGSPTSPQLAQTSIEEAIQLEKAENTWEYGKDWVNLGYKLLDDPWLRALTADIPSAITQDWRGTPLAEIPVMKGVRHFGPDGEVSMVLEITASNTIDRWYQFLSPTRVKIGLACTGVMAPEQYPFLDSGQLSGLLTGMKGAAEYEQILDAPGFGMTAMAGQSFAHLYIVLLILLGNLSVLIGARRRRR